MPVISGVLDMIVAQYGTPRPRGYQQVIGLGCSLRHHIRRSECGYNLYLDFNLKLWPQETCSQGLLCSDNKGITRLLLKSVIGCMIARAWTKMGSRVLKETLPDVCLTEK